MAELENIANRAEQFEKQTADAHAFEPVDEKVTSAIPGFDPLEAAKNRAAVIMQTLGVGAKAFIDTRLEFPPEEILAGQEGLAPLLAKYNLVGEGNGNLPYQEEITAGLYLGGLFRRLRKALAYLREVDKAEAEKKKQEQQSNGDQRKHQPEEQSQPVSREERVREKPDADTPRWLGGIQ